MVKARNRLDESFYKNPDTVALARSLLGKVLVTHLDGCITSGIISETEAYNGVADRASHAYGGRRTARTEIMYSEGGTAYVYLCYGIHELFNVVTGATNDPKAVLIRGIIPLEGMPIMLLRRNNISANHNIGKGPGNVTKCLGITRLLNGCNLIHSNDVWLENRNISIKNDTVITTPRIGVDYAGEDALLPYRFLWSGFSG